MLHRHQCLEEKTNKLMKPISSDYIILANMNVKLFSWTFTFLEVVRQQNTNQ